MNYKKKLSLSELKIKSFVTDLDPQSSKALYGGSCETLPTGCGCTDPTTGGGGSNGANTCYTFCDYVSDPCACV